VRIKTTGMKRSGHHGVMYWITANMDMNTFLIEPPGICVMEKRNYPKEAIRTGFKENLCIFNREEIHNNNIKEYESVFAGKPHKKVITMRFAPNLFASRLALEKKVPNSLFGKGMNKRAFEIYEWQIDKIKKDYFDVVVLYEEFMAVWSYRTMVGEALGLNSNSMFYFNQTSKDGDGSSFDGLAKNPSEMNVTERYKRLSQEEAQVIIKRKKIMKYNKKNFPGYYCRFMEYFNL